MTGRYGEAYTETLRAMIAAMNPFRHNPLNVPLAAGVRRVGFQKWYERELLSSHAHMVLAIFSVIALLASFEAMNGGTMQQQLMNLAFVLVSAGISYWALRRYLYLLLRAEVIANQANCSDCGAYGRFQVVGDCKGNTGSSARVACLKCTNKWTITADDEPEE